MIIDLTLHPSLTHCADELIWTHSRMRQFGWSSYELGPYATRDIVADLREQLSESQKDYACLAKELDGHDATECLMNLRQLKEDAWKYRDLCKQPQ